MSKRVDRFGRPAMIMLFQDPLTGTYGVWQPQNYLRKDLQYGMTPLLFYSIISGIFLPMLNVLHFPCHNSILLL